MDLPEFHIDVEFKCGGNVWRCTDVETRVIIAINLSSHPDDHSWFIGPPYAVGESVFDKDSMTDCELI